MDARGVCATRTLCVRSDLGVHLGVPYAAGLAEGGGPLGRAVDVVKSVESDGTGRERASHCLEEQREEGGHLDGMDAVREERRDAEESLVEGLAAHAIVTLAVERPVGLCCGQCTGAIEAPPLARAQQHLMQCQLPRTVLVKAKAGRLLSS